MRRLSISALIGLDLAELIGCLAFLAYAIACLQDNAGIQCHPTDGDARTLAIDLAHAQFQAVRSRAPVVMKFTTDDAGRITAYQFVSSGEPCDDYQLPEKRRFGPQFQVVADHKTLQFLPDGKVQGTGSIHLRAGNRDRQVLIDPRGSIRIL